MIPRCVLHLRGGMSWATHLPCSVSMNCASCRALLKKEIYSCWPTCWSLMLGTGHTAVFSIRCTWPEIIAWCLQAKVNLGLWLTNARMTFNIRVCERHRNGIWVVLHSLIKLLLPWLIPRYLLSLCTLRHVPCNHPLSHVVTRPCPALFRAYSLRWANLKLRRVFGTTSPRALFLLLSTYRRSHWGYGALGVRKNLGELLNGRVENSLLVVIVEQVDWL